MLVNQGFGGIIENFDIKNYDIFLQDLTIRDLWIKLDTLLSGASAPFFCYVSFVSVNLLYL